MASDLLKCPFCGEPATVSIVGGGWYWIGCQEDFCDVNPFVETKDMPASYASGGEGFPVEIYEMLKVRWNKRTSS